MKILAALTILAVPAGAIAHPASETPATPQPLKVSPAVAPAPSDESVREFIALVGLRERYEEIFAAMKPQLIAQVNKATEAGNGVPEQKAIRDRLLAKVMQAVEKIDSWPAIEDTYVEIYRRAFTQDEIDALLAFYKSPAGRMFVQKSDLLNQKSRQILKKQEADMRAQLSALFQEGRAQLVLAASPETPTSR